MSYRGISQWPLLRFGARWLQRFCDICDMIYSKMHFHMFSRPAYVYMFLAGPSSLFCHVSFSNDTDFDELFTLHTGRKDGHQQRWRVAVRWVCADGTFLDALCQHLDAFAVFGTFQAAETCNISCRRTLIAYRNISMVLCWWTNFQDTFGVPPSPVLI